MKCLIAILKIMFHCRDHDNTDNLENPINEVVLLKNNDLTMISDGRLGKQREDVVQLQPQEIRVKIRNGLFVIDEL